MESGYAKYFFPARRRLHAGYYPAGIENNENKSAVKLKSFLWNRTDNVSFEPLSSRNTGTEEIGRTKTWDLTIDAPQRLQETIYCMS